MGKGNELQERLGQEFKGDVSQIFSLCSEEEVCTCDILMTNWPLLVSYNVAF